jgi:hypothetical protein
LIVVFEVALADAFGDVDGSGLPVLLATLLVVMDEQAHAIQVTGRGEVTCQLGHGYAAVFGQARERKQLVVGADNGRSVSQALQLRFHDVLAHGGGFELGGEKGKDHVAGDFHLLGLVFELVVVCEGRGGLMRPGGSGDAVSNVAVA